MLVLSGGKDGKERRFAPLLVSDVMVTEKGTVLANPPGFNRAIGSELRLAEPELDDLSRQVDETLVAGDRLSLTQTVRRLMDVLGLKSAGTIDPSRLSGAVTPGPVDRVQNAAVLFAADASEGIQAGLLADLDDIRKSPNKIDSSALGALAEIPGTGEDPPDEVRIVTPDRLNESQEQVIRSAMTQRLTVAQGPPGTGKSQLVAALVATATSAGHSVLVGSTNNRAVDEVVERIRRTSAPGLLIRTGSREYRAAEPALLRELMTSASNVPADEETPTADVRILQQEIAELRHALDRRRRCERTAYGGGMASTCDGMAPQRSTSSAEAPVRICGSTRTTRWRGGSGRTRRSQEARERDVPVFLSVGYSACHWCHVMAHESFEDAATAAYLNEHFVSIKVDREERPDVDAIYMAATVAMIGQGGWPMSVFLTPDAEPFFCGTYFPKDARGGMASFRQVLESLTDAWQTKREQIDGIGRRVVEQLGAQQQPARGSSTPRGRRSC